MAIICAEDAPLTCCGDPNSRCAKPSEEEIVETVGGAGDLMKCDNEAVVALLAELNNRRETRGNAPLVCDDKATGAAENWSEMMCNKCVLSIFQISPSICECTFGYYLSLINLFSSIGA